MPSPLDEAPPRTQVLAVAAQGPTSPAFRIRVLLPSATLKDNGVEIVPRPLFAAEEERAFRGAPAWARPRILLQARRRLRRELSALEARGEVALIQRQADMLPTLAIERRAAAGRRLVLDVDDAIWLDTSPGAGGHPLAFLKNSRHKVRELATRAETVIAGNAILAEWLEPHASSIVIVPSLVDPRAVAVREHGERERVVWGWIGSPSSASALYERLPALERAAAELGLDRVELVVVGAPTPRDRRIRIRSIPWSEPAERWALQLFDVGLMPLRDDPWTRGKCAYKAEQYMSAGIPVVADDVGVSADVVGDAEGGLIAAQPDDWVSALLALSRDPALRQRLGGGGRQRVERDFSVGRWGPVLAKVLRGEPAEQPK